MNNEPIAWIRDGDDQLSLVRQKDDGYMVWKPLYAHPVSQYQSITNTKIEPTVVSYTHPVKELTDEEILEIADANEWHKDEFAIKFARAILRKAQEK